MDCKTTAEIRQEIWKSPESVRALARRFGLSPTTVQKWRKRGCAGIQTNKARLGRPPLLSDADIRAITMFRLQTLLPLDDCYYALLINDRKLSRATLYRYFKQQGVGSLAAVDGGRLGNTRRGQMLGDVLVGVNPIETVHGCIYVFVAFDRTSKFALIRAAPALIATTALSFLDELIKEMPFAEIVQTTDHNAFVGRHDIADNSLGDAASFTGRCRANGIEHRVISPLPLPDEMMVPVEDGAEKYAEPWGFMSLDEIAEACRQQTNIYNRRCRLKALGGRTPSEYVTSRVDCEARPPATFRNA